MSIKNREIRYLITEDELTETILNGVDQKLNIFEKKFQPKEPTQWLTRKEVSKIFSVSLVTIADWSKKGILKPFRIGNRVRFRRIDIENAPTKTRVE